MAPRLGVRKAVPGPPKRFAQAIGAVVSTAALMLALGAGTHLAADALLIALGMAAGLESIFGYCVGCKLFGWLMRVGVVRIRAARNAGRQPSAGGPLTTAERSAP